LFGGGIFRDECPGLGLRSLPFLVSKVAVSFARRIPARSQADVRYNAAISGGGGGGRLAVRTRSHARVMQSPQFMQETSHPAAIKSILKCGHYTDIYSQKKTVHVEV